MILFLFSGALPLRSVVEQWHPSAATVEASASWGPILPAVASPRSAPAVSSTATAGSMRGLQADPEPKGTQLLDFHLSSPVLYMEKIYQINGGIVSFNPAGR
jgi:hypothetical protein